MRAILLWAGLLFLALLTPADAGTTLANPNGAGQVILWRAEDDYHACVAERQAIRRFGPICMSGVVALLPDGTPIRRMGGWLFVKVQVLGGPSAGRIGYVVAEEIKP